MAIDLSARIDAAVAAAQGDEGAPAGLPGEGEGSSGAAPATIEDAAADIVAAPMGVADPEIEARTALIKERLASQREQRQAAKLAAEARADREEAARDREAARGDRSKWEALKQGSFKEGIAALGKDPLTVFQEMQREAIEASTPEAEIKRMRADFERQMGEKLTPLQETIEELKAERAEALAEKDRMALTSAFTREAVAPEFLSLRTEYEDADLFGYVKNFVENPEQFEAAAEVYGVTLTDPEQGFTMREILTVLKAAQDAHDNGRKQRAARFQPAATQAAPSAAKLTVNGTAERRNAGTTIGNDLAGERAAPPPTLSRQQRVQAEIDRLSRR